MSLDINFETDALDDLFEQVKEIDGKNEIPITELLTPDFIQQHTDAADLSEYVENGDFEKDFDEIPNKEWSKYVKRTSDFESWEDMYSAAAKKWVVRQLE